jgi:protein involved in polysaccharide export with SLBB domain
MTTASLKRSTQRFLTLLSAVALAGAIAPAAAGAQVPSYAQNGGDTIRGTVASIDGKYDISVRDDRGFVDNVSLHDGTVINPTGLTLAPGETVTIEGRPAGATFVADEIDTPYTYGYAYPYPVYPADRFGLHVGGRGFGFGFRG